MCWSMGLGNPVSHEAAVKQEGQDRALGLMGGKSYIHAYINSNLVHHKRGVRQVIQAKAAAMQIICTNYKSASKFEHGVKRMVPYAKTK